MSFLDRLPHYFSNLWRPRPLRYEVNGGGHSYIFASNRQATWQKRDYIESFNCVPEVNAVINLKGNAFSNGLFKVVDAKKKETEFPNEPILQLLNNPNWFQAKGEFMKQTKLGHEVFGNEYLYFTTPFGFDTFDAKKAKALYTITGDMMCVEYNEDIPYFFFTNDSPPKKIKYSYKDADGKEHELDAKNIIHYNENRIGGISPTDKNLLLGQSKLEVLAAPINNIRASYESRGVILVERGANGAWVPADGKDSFGGSTPLRPEEKEDISEQFLNKGTMFGQQQFILAPRAIRFEQAGNFRPKDLGLFEETEEDFRKIQDEYGTPPELFARPDGTTYENQNQARKGLYTETIIPEAAAWTNGLSMKVYPNRDKLIVLDYTHLQIFQDDIKIKAEKVKAIIENLSLLLADGMISIEEYREEIFKHGIGNGKPLPPKEVTAPPAVEQDDGAAPAEVEEVEIIEEEDKTYKQNGQTKRKISA